MARIIWDGSRPYDVGLDRGVLYLADSSGVVWNGLLSVVESTTDDKTKPLYFDGIRYAITTAIEDFSFVLSAFTYPDQFEQYNGSSGIFDGQTRNTFGFAYRVKTESAYEIHIVYNALAQPAVKNWKPISAAVDISPLSWKVTSVPAWFLGGGPSAHIVIDTAVAYPEFLIALEDILYGSPSTSPRLPSVSELITLAKANPRMLITDNGDGTWTATGPDDAIKVYADGTFEITWPKAEYIGEALYTIETS